MALLFDIKRYAINDGPGIRITLFVKGCPLSCVWCHNPEGVKLGKQKLYTKSKCIGCSSCVEACPQNALRLTKDGIVSDDSRCVLCGKCVEACPTLALEMSGTEYSYDELMTEILKETTVMDRSKGGVTFCGGEPLIYPEWLLEMLRRCGEKDIHRCVDTTLFAKSEIVKEVAENCELFLVDLKHMDSEKHRAFCGVRNELILKNLRMIAEMGCAFWIRIPLIDGVNADEENLIASADFLASLPWQGERKVGLLPYHDVARGKHEKLRTIYNPNGLKMNPPTEEQKERALQIFKDKGFLVSIGG